jgi:hypothetical protein
LIPNHYTKPSWNPDREEKKLNIHIYYLEKEEKTIEIIENHERRNQKITKESNDEGCFEKGNDLLGKDQIKLTASEISGSQLIMLSYSKNHQKPYGTLIYYRIEEV